MNQKYVLRADREEGGFWYIVSIAAFGFPIQTSNIIEATIFNDYESAKSAQGTIAGSYDVVEV